MTGRIPHVAILVLGMHRSGTSAATRVLNLLGADLGTELLQPAQDNAKGFWEHKQVVAIHERLLAELGRNWQDVRSLPVGWEQSAAAQNARDALVQVLAGDFSESPFWAVKDPRLCRLLPLWLPLSDILNVRFHTLHVSRHPDEIASSLQARNNMSLEHARLLWMRYAVEANLGSRALPRAALPYVQLLSDWKGSLASVAAQLGLTWPVELDDAAQAVDDFLSPMERHHKAALSEGVLPKLLQQLCDAYASPPSDARWPLIDSCVDACENASGAILPGVDYLHARLDAAEAGLAAAMGNEKALAERNECMLAELAEVVARLPGRIKLAGARTSVAKVYYRTDDEHYVEERSVACAWPEDATRSTLAFELVEPASLNFLRFDPMDHAGQFEVSSVKIDGIELKSLDSRVVHFNQYRIATPQGGIRFASSDADPHLDLLVSTDRIKARRIEIECRSISAGDEQAEAVDRLLAGRLQTLQLALNGVIQGQAALPAQMLERWRNETGDLRALIEAEARAAAEARKMMQQRLEMLDQQYQVISQQLQRGLLGLFRRKY
ncbi:hypothetical protein P5Y53_16995 [Dyella jiangningensis]|uniref:sulfotransferase family protein n=1 Tax=Dyella jiangningensis TaxID=1379159 RepID=UPI00240F7ED7|nr:hypothetical protein [Dyella jiangningensis]MDG2539377.1 hypothetical protein [Dyella jiangningensis]